MTSHEGSNAHTRRSEESAGSLSPRSPWRSGRPGLLLGRDQRQAVSGRLDLPEQDRPGGVADERLL